MEKYKKKAALFLISQGISLFGSSIVQFAIIWSVTLQTSSGIWVSILTVAAYVPQFIISFFSGVWADRHSKKLLIILSDSMIAVSTLLLVILLPFLGEGTPFLVALVVISVIRSIGTGIQTPAVNSVIPQLVPEEKLMKFNGVNSTIQALVQFTAPATAGAILSLGTFAMTMMIDIITAVVAISILFAIKIPFTRSESSASAFSEMKDGIKYAVTNKFIGKVLLIFGIFIFLTVPAGFLASLFVTRYYGATGDKYWYLTLVEVIGFVGMMGGGLLISVWGGFKRRIKTMLVGMAAFGALAIGMGAVDNLVVYLILMAIYGIALTMFQTASTTLLQENAPAEMQGRVFGLFGAMFSGFLPLGMVLFGPLADVVSLRLLMIISGALLLLMVFFILLDKKFRNSEKIKTEETKTEEAKTEEPKTEEAKTE